MSAPLNIAFFVDDFPVVSETFVTNLAESVLAQGHRLTVLARQPRAANESHVAASPRDAGLARLVRRSALSGRLGLPQVAALSRDHPAKAGALLGLWGLDRVARRETLAVTRLMAGQGPFDVVHAQFATLGQTAQRHRDYGTLRTRALVVHLRGYDITSHVAEHGPQGYARLFARAELFIANCEFFRRKAVAMGCPEDRCIVIGSPVDTSFFAPPAEPRTPPDGRPLQLVSVGRLVEKKGFEDAIDAVARLRARGREVTLDILGGGPLEDALARRIAAARLGGAVRLHGAQPREVVRDALHRADIGIASSRTAANGDQDAAVNTLKEMMATGLPVVATRHGGIPELVKHRENGLLAAEADADALAAAIATLADAPDDWPRLRQAGRARVVRDYDSAAVLDRTLRAYTIALGREGEAA